MTLRATHQAYAAMLLLLLAVAGFSIGLGPHEPKTGSAWAWAGIAALALLATAPILASRGRLRHLFLRAARVAAANPPEPDRSRVVLQRYHEFRLYLGSLAVGPGMAGTLLYHATGAWPALVFLPVSIAELIALWPTNQRLAAWAAIVAERP